MPTAQNGQTHSSNLSVVADELFEFVWPFCEDGAWRVNIMFIKVKEMCVLESETTDVQDQNISHWMKTKTRH